MKTTLATKSDHAKNWYIVDAANETLGRISVKIANVLRGRHKPTYTPHADTGDFVVVVNAEKIKVSGKKNTDKSYMFYSGWICLLYTSPSPRDMSASRMPSSA